jgi:hypothetical protein
MTRSKTYAFTLPVVAGEPVDPSGYIASVREAVREVNELRRAHKQDWYRMRVRVRGRLGKDNPFAKLIDFRGARDINLLYAQRCDVYVETVAPRRRRK